ncbi:MAG: cell division protein ZapE [Geminicoccaceae bacterium]
MDQDEVRGPLALYRQRLEAGELSPDPDQERAVEALDRLAARLADYRPAAPSKGFLSRLRGRADGAETPRGLYLWGGVGRGKSMVMDLFFEASSVERKRRAHFHEFMIDVHERLHRRRQEQAKEEEPLIPLAAALADQAWLLCFDEFHVSNIVDAMILGRLFDHLFKNGVVVVATSNWQPERLYENGLQRDRFEPFIGLLKEQVDVVALDGDRDYRLDRLRGMDVYHQPLGEEAERALAEAFAYLTDGETPVSESIEVGSRKITVPKAAKRVAWFAFDDLCSRALGAADYLALARAYQTLIVENIPRLTPDMRNEARRFMTLVDAIYEQGMHLVCSAAVPPAELYQTGDGAFEFQRTASRLIEMQSADYVEKAKARALAPRPIEPYALTSDLI